MNPTERNVRISGVCPERWGVEVWEGIGFQGVDGHPVLPLKEPFWVRQMQNDFVRRAPADVKVRIYHHLWGADVLQAVDPAPVRLGWIHFMPPLAEAWLSHFARYLDGFIVPNEAIYQWIRQNVSWIPAKRLILLEGDRDLGDSGFRGFGELGGRSVGFYFPLRKRGFRADRIVEWILALRRLEAFRDCRFEVMPALPDVTVPQMWKDLPDVACLAYEADSVRRKAIFDGWQCAVFCGDFDGACHWQDELLMTGVPIVAPEYFWMNDAAKAAGAVHYPTGDIESAMQILQQKMHQRVQSGAKIATSDKGSHGIADAEWLIGQVRDFPSLERRRAWGGWRFLPVHFYRRFVNQLCFAHTDANFD